jgi:hypothetical protein
LKKKEREQNKAWKDDEKLRRAFLAEEVAAERKSRGETPPLRSKSTKEIASQIVKTLSLRRPLNKLSQRVKEQNSANSCPPTLDDFDSKQEVHDYLNPSTTSNEIAELPADLPQYTPFEDSTRTQHNERANLLDSAVTLPSRADGRDAKENGATESPKLAAKGMRCDSCESPIRIDQTYYHCEICEDGDQILCYACVQTRGCRHEIVERVRSIAKEGASDRPRRTGRGQSEFKPPATAVSGVKSTSTAKKPDDPLAAIMVSAAIPCSVHDKVTMPTPNIASGEMTKTMPKLEETRAELHSHREQELQYREKNMVIREREAAIRERQTSLCQQENALHLKQQLFALQLQLALVQQSQKASTNDTASTQGVSEDVGVRTHATNNKDSGSHNTVSPSKSTGSNGGPSRKRSCVGRDGGGDEDVDEAGSGTPKKIKRDPDFLDSPAKLFACPYCKYDRSNYSEQNDQEKHYRGCSSGYWPDISRLKQHLYRVHSLRCHCVRCWAKFDKKDQLDQHARQTASCDLVECPCPEKFNDNQYNEIRRKRPTLSSEQVWYTIYAILFPGQPQPASPYADDVNAQSKAASPVTVPECKDTMAVLGELFESHLEQYVDVPEHAWLHWPGAREFIREQLRASMTEVIQGLKPVGSPSLGNASTYASPSSAMAPDLTRPGSINLTPASSIPPSPDNGSTSNTSPSMDSPFLIPHHRQSFSRPLPSRAARNSMMVVEPPSTNMQTQTQTPMPFAPDTDVFFPHMMPHDPEADQYDAECDSWRQGDDFGLPLLTHSDFDFGFESILPSPVEQPQHTPMPPNETVPCMASDSAVQPTIHTIQHEPKFISGTVLKPTHSTSSSVDSGYGSVKYHASASSRQSSTSEPQPRRKPVNKGKGRSKTIHPQAQVPEPREESIMPELAINFETFRGPYPEFVHVRDLDLGMNGADHGDLGHVNFSTYLNSGCTMYNGIPGSGLGP